MSQLSYQEKMMIKDRADLVREHYFDSDDCEYPINVVSIAEKLGFKVLKFIPRPEDNESIAGMMSFDKKTILLNGNDSYERRMFTLAHEIGHIVLHEDTIKSNRNGRDIAYRKDLRNSSDVKMELEANEFAANLLMPQELFQLLYNKFEGKIRYIAMSLGVSYSAAAVRLDRLKIK